MHTRENALNKWLDTLFTQKPFQLTPLKGDASFRRYLRLNCAQQTFIVMDAPPPKEDIVPFIQVDGILNDQGIHAPKIYAADDKQGFILLEDLGDRVLLNELTPDTVDAFYEAAMKIILKIQTCEITKLKLPPFDNHFMFKEIAMFREWFLQDYLAMHMSHEEEAMLESTFTWLVCQISKQTKILIHRDFHSRNLMLVQSTPTVDLGVIDFQDAMIGPLTYDLASLLKDCYIQWPHEKLNEWLTSFYAQLPSSIRGTKDDFKLAFELCGLQRHLKVLGIFCRLNRRDNKPNYLNDLPLTFHYAITCLESVQELRPFYDFMRDKVQPMLLEKRS